MQIIGNFTDEQVALAVKYIGGPDAIYEVCRQAIAAAIQAGVLAEMAETENQRRQEAVAVVAEVYPAPSPRTEPVEPVEEPAEEPDE
jgi:hypothetical protein